MNTCGDCRADEYEVCRCRQCERCGEDVCYQEYCWWVRDVACCLSCVEDDPTTTDDNDNDWEVDEDEIITMRRHKRTRGDDFPEEAAPCSK